MRAVDEPAYDRQLLLSGEKRNAVPDRWEVQRYGTDAHSSSSLSSSSRIAMVSFGS